MIDTRWGLTRKKISPRSSYNYLNNTCLWVSEITPLRLWHEFAFAFTVLVKTVDCVVKFHKLQELKTGQKWQNVFNKMQISDMAVHFK